MQLLRFVIRPSRSDGTPKLKGLYYFTPLQNSADYSVVKPKGRQHQSSGVTNSVGAQLGAGASSSGDLHRHLVQSAAYQSSPWYSATGDIFDSGPLDSHERMAPHIDEQWANLIQACQGIIAFDAVLCSHVSNQMHETSWNGGPAAVSGLTPRIATIILGGCQNCGSCPEKPAYAGNSSEDRLPLVIPPPLHSSSIKAAQRLDTNGLPHPPFIARCRMCLEDRWCERCDAWWCESCYSIPQRGVTQTISDDSLAGKHTGQSIKVHNNICVSIFLM